MQSRIEKSVAHFLAVTLAPECGEVFKTIRAKRNGWIKMPAWLEQARKNSGLGDTYVTLYEAEPRIHYCLINRPLKNVFEVADARKKQAKKCSLCLINEHF